MTLHSLSLHSADVDEAIVIKWRQRNMKENFYNQLTLALLFFYFSTRLFYFYLLFWVPPRSRRIHFSSCNCPPFLSPFFHAHPFLSQRCWKWKCEIYWSCSVKRERRKIHNIKKTSRCTWKTLFFFNENSLKWVAPFASSHCMLKWNLIRTLKQGKNWIMR